MTHDWIQLHAQPIDVGPVSQFVSDEHAGGIAMFLGTTRAQGGPQGASLVALDYQAYEEMAREKMNQLAVGARSTWPIQRLAILHRTGRVALGETSVIIAVSTPHRAQAFEACRWLIDTLKAEVPIWKKEVWGDGREQWVAGNTP
jgi:molybdopterin synthase catalytic subunit